MIRINSQWIVLIIVHLVQSTPMNYPNKMNHFITPNHISDLEVGHMKKAMGDVKTTIAEVQKILETDPTLPRLTRGEIEELFENVTREEFEKSMRNGDQSRAKHMRALMLVLPYNTNNYSEDHLQELYTKPPVTRVISNESKQKKPQKVMVTPSEMLDINISEKQTPSTYKPTLVTKTKNQYDRPTTFHPAKTTKTPLPVKISKTTTTLPPPTTSEQTEKYSSHYSDNRPPFPIISQPPIRENVKDLLATIGLTQELQPTTTKAPEMTQELRDLLQSFGLLTNEEPPKHLQYDDIALEPIQEEFQPITSYIQDDSFHIDENPISPAPVRNPTYRMNIAPELTPDDFSQFKPLPIPEETVIPNEMEEFFKSYGLWDSGSRGQKSLKNLEISTIRTITTTTTTQHYPPKMMEMPEVSVDFLTPDLINVLGNIGINRKIDEFPTAETATTPRPKHLQKIANIDLSEEEFKKLHNILDSIKKLDRLNANLTDEEIEESFELNQFNVSGALLSDQGPDPTDNLELLGDDYNKNEIKRQSAEDTTESPTPIRFTLDLQATTEEISEKELFNGSAEARAFQTSTSAPVTTTAATTSTTTTKTTTEEPRRSNSNLGDSGGLDPVGEVPLPAPRHNGFYFFSDWNSFLEVGEDPDKVIVRFDPKIGDSSRFLNVKIP